MKKVEVKVKPFLTPKLIHSHLKSLRCSFSIPEYQYVASILYRVPRETLKESGFDFKKVLLSSLDEISSPELLRFKVCLRQKIVGSSK